MRVAVVARSIVVGAGATLVLKYAVGIPMSALFRGLSVEHPFARVLMASWTSAAATALAWIATGWIVSRLHRAHPALPVMSYAIFINLWSLPRTWTVMSNAFDDVRYLPALFAHGTWVVTATVGLFMGGWLANLGRPRAAPERVTPV
jgi:hypothetical protein